MLLQFFELMHHPLETPFTAHAVLNHQLARPTALAAFGGTPQLTTRKLSVKTNILPGTPLNSARLPYLLTLSPRSKLNVLHSRAIHANFSISIDHLHFLLLPHSPFSPLVIITATDCTESNGYLAAFKKYVTHAKIMQITKL